MGIFHLPAAYLHDHEPYGNLSVEQIITKSSNIGAAKIGIKMGEDRLYDYITSYGFGTRTGLPLPGEVRRHRRIRSKIGAKFPWRKFPWDRASRSRVCK